MTNSTRSYNHIIVALLLGVIVVFSGCGATRHIPEDKVLLRKNTVKFKTNTILFNKGEVRDNLARIVLQKPNTYIGPGIKVPLKLWLYNLGYKKLHSMPDSLLPKNRERPVLLDTSYINRTVFNMRSYLFNQGYFYAKITDTIVYKRRKAYVTYNVNSGGNYLINNIYNNVDDSGILKVVQSGSVNSVLVRNRPFSYSLLDEERSRLLSLIRNNGYYRFSQENIRFELDTMDKAFLRDIDNPLKNAINFISSSRKNRLPTIDVKVFIRTRDDSAGIPYRIGAVTVYPDYEGSTNLGDSLHVEQIDSILFKYNEEYVHANVLAERIYLSPGNIYSQDEQDRTIAKLNELGIFQYIRIRVFESSEDSILKFNIYLSRNKKLDFGTNFEVSNGGSTYSLGTSLGATFRNKNFAKGANLLNISLNGGVELGDTLQNRSFQHIRLITQYYGLNTSLDFPRFIAPLPRWIFDNYNLPHTIVSLGANVVNRVLYFTLTNTSASYRYNWRQSETKVWDLSPAFVNIIRLRDITARFREKLNSSPFLSNSYKELFIEGENLNYTFSNVEKKKGRNYTRLKLGIEEAGGLLSGIDKISADLIDYDKNPYAQYTKFDFDLQRFVSLPHSVFALRFYGGVGTPNGRATALPYVKQYYVGGPYSLRGWRIRTLGPGSYYDSTAVGKLNTIDRTGDIKLEFNGEYRFPIVPLFSGIIKMNGALFMDAGNIWLARKDDSTKGAEFAFNKLGQDIAMDMGAGARFEIASFFTFRLDAGIPVKKPYILQNGGWVFNKIDFNSADWRTNNIILNLSIGYPF